MKKRGTEWEIVEVAMVMVTARFVGAKAMTGLAAVLAKDVTVKESAQSVVAQARTNWWATFGFQSNWVFCLLYLSVKENHGIAWRWITINKKVSNTCLTPSRNLMKLLGTYRH